MKKYYEPVLLVVLTAAGIGLIAVGSILMCQHQQFEMGFQYRLLDKLGPDYHWRSIGDGYFGLGAVIAGTFLMTVAVIVALVNRALERPQAAPNGASSRRLTPGQAPASRHPLLDPAPTGQTGFPDDSIDLCVPKT